MKIFFSSTHRFRQPKIIIPLIALFLCIGLAAAAIFTMFSVSNTATVKTPDVRLVAGSDSSGGTTYPSATVTVTSTYDYATVEFSLFPSVESSPQPATYYTDLLQINNAGTEGHTIKSITITSLNDQSNLGGITIYYCEAQTDTPQTGNLDSVALTSSSNAPVSLFTGTQSIAASATQYIEVVGYALSTAAVDDTITFTVSIEWV